MEELARLVRGKDVEFRDVERSLEPWLMQTQTPDRAADEIRKALANELQGGPPTGFRPREVEGEPRFLHTMASIIG